MPQVTETFLSVTTLAVSSGTTFRAMPALGDMPGLSGLEALVDQRQGLPHLVAFAAATHVLTQRPVQGLASQRRSASTSPDTMTSRCRVIFSAGQFHQAMDSSIATTSGGKRCLMGRAGLPPTTV